MTLYLDDMDASLLIDAHTHLPYSKAGVAVEQTTLEVWKRALPGRYYSVGIHPQALSAVDDFDCGREVELLNRAAVHPQVVAVGEAGLDKNYPDLGAQAALFVEHIQLANRLGKPLIIHQVGAYDKLLSLHQSFPGHTPWIVHGFRRNAILTKQLCRCGFYLSYGRYYHEEALRVTPLSQLLIETDEATDLKGGIESLYARAASLLGLSPVRLQQIVNANLQHLFLHR